MGRHDSRDDDGSRCPAGAVVFDMDGTLTVPYFDFDAIRREIGLPTEPRTPILEAMEKMSPEQQAQTREILEKHERIAAEASELQPDAVRVVRTLRQAGLPVGLLTRNSRSSMQMVMEKHGLSFEAAFSREDGPIKPSPATVLAACERLGVAPESTWVVGDYLFDIQAGNAAGAVSVLKVNDDELPDFAGEADHVIRELGELLDLLNLSG